MNGLALTVVIITSGNFEFQMRSTKKSAYFTDRWNLLSMAAIITYIVGISLQHVENLYCFEAARIFRSLNFAILMYHLLQYLCILPFMGPLITMLSKLVSTVFQHFIFYPPNFGLSDLYIAEDHLIKFTE
jgi:Ion transport protein